MPFDGVQSPSRAITMTERNIREKPSMVECQSIYLEFPRDNLQSTEQRQPTRPSVFEYPTRKQRGFRHFGEAKKCVHLFESQQNSSYPGYKKRTQYSPPEVGMEEAKSACFCQRKFHEFQVYVAYHCHSHAHNEPRRNEPSLNHSVEYYSH